MALVVSVTEFEGQGHSHSQPLMIPAMPPNYSHHANVLDDDDSTFFSVLLRPSTKILRIRCHEGFLAVTNSPGFAENNVNPDHLEEGASVYLPRVMTTLTDYGAVEEPFESTSMAYAAKRSCVILASPDEHIYAVQDREYGGHGYPSPDALSNRDRYYFHWFRNNE